MREVLGFSAKEVADSLETTVASVNSALQRARKTIEDKMPAESQQATLRALGDRKIGEIVNRYMDALGAADVDSVVGMLAEDAAWSMPPAATYYRGDRVTDFLRFGPLSGAWAGATCRRTSTGRWPSACTRGTRRPARTSRSRSTS